jgi:hypothetical protein
MFASGKALVRIIGLVLPIVIADRISMRMAGVNDIAVWALLPHSLDALCIGALLAILTGTGRMVSGDRTPFIIAMTGLIVWGGWKYAELAPVCPTK